MGVTFTRLADTAELPTVEIGLSVQTYAYVCVYIYIHTCIQILSWGCQRANPKKIVGTECEKPGRYIPVIFLLYSLGPIVESL